MLNTSEYQWSIQYAADAAKRELRERAASVSRAAAAQAESVEDFPSVIIKSTSAGN